MFFLKNLRIGENYREFRIQPLRKKKAELHIVKYNRNGNVMATRLRKVFDRALIPPWVSQRVICSYSIRNIQYYLQVLKRVRRKHTRSLSNSNKKAEWRKELLSDRRSRVLLRSMYIKDYRLLGLTVPDELFV